MNNSFVNVLANYAGRVGSVLLGLVLVPIYLKYLGPEAYGLMGIYVAVQAVISLFDLGLSSVLARESAKSNFDEYGQQHLLSNITRTLEYIMCSQVILIVLSCSIFVPVFGRSVVGASELSDQTVSSSLLYIGYAAAVRLPVALYIGLLNGRQLQVRANLLILGANLFRGLGAVLLLSFFGAHVEDVFLWFLLCNVVELVCGGFLAWAVLKGGFFKARFDLKLLAKSWKFAGGVVYITLTAGAIAQVDKLVVSNLVSLKEFAYYSVSVTLAFGLLNLVYPVTVAALPKFTSMISANQIADLKSVYREYTQALVVIVMPIAIVMIVCSDDVVSLYLMGSDHVDTISGYLRIVAFGVLFSSLAPLPHTMQLANGWTSLISLCNTFFAIAYIASLVFLVPLYGLPFVLMLWVAYSAAYLICLSGFMHTRILRGEFLSWILYALVKPLLFGGVVCVCLSDLLRVDGIPRLLQVLICYLFTLIVVVACYPYIRSWLYCHFTSIFRGNSIG